MRAVFLLLVLCASPVVSAEPVELRIATLAPSGSAWAKIMEEGNSRLSTETEGRARFRIYFNGAQGDERDVVRKMKLGQIDGAALTTVGLGMISPDLLVLQLPYLFQSEKQLDHVRDTLGPEFAKRLDAAGYVLVSWGDVGWVHTFFTADVKSPADVTKAKFAQLADDPISKEMFAALGVNGVPMGIIDIRRELQLGSVQAANAPPLAVVALQWHTALKYMADKPSTYAIGALILRKSAFERMTPADREALLRGAKETGAKLVATVRRDNQRATKALAKAGIVTVVVPDETQARLVAAAAKVRGKLAGKLYSKEILDLVVRTAAEVR
jgi:TRAP-type C4-dicarboxylate transport system substrate-binding protein